MDEKQEFTPNITGIVDEQDTLHTLSVFELGLWFALYGIIAFLSVTGNSLVIYTILRRARMQSVTNYFILNLAIGDAITGLLAIPFKFQAALLQRWVLPHFMCQVVPFIETVSLSVSVFTLSGSAIDRFRAVIWEQKPKMTKPAAKLIIFFIWVVSLACSTPYGLYHQPKGYPGMIPNSSNGSINLVYQCMPTYAETVWWKVYNVYLTIIQYFVPLVIINGAYCVIGYKVWLTESVVDIRDPRSIAFEQSKKKVLKMLVMVVMVFTFCWLPYETYLVLVELRPNINDYYYINAIFFCCHWLAMSNSCLNPIIYGIYNEKFQKEYKRTFHNCCQCVADSRMERVTSNNIRLTQRNSARHQQHHAAPLINSCHHYIASELGKDF